MKQHNPSPALDPLYVIFEQHLFNFQDPDVDRKSLIHAIVQDYLGYLRKQNITVPKSLEQPIVEELSAQVNTMLVKKIYGCLSVQEFQLKSDTKIKRRAKSRYSSIKSKSVDSKAVPRSRSRTRSAG